MRIFRRKYFRKINRFVDGNNRRNVRAVEQFKNRNAKNRKIATRNARERPIFCAVRDDFVDARKMFERSRDKLFRERIILARLRLLIFKKIKERFRKFPRLARAHAPRIKKLHRSNAICTATGNFRGSGRSRGRIIRLGRHKKFSFLSCVQFL